MNKKTFETKVLKQKYFGFFGFHGDVNLDPLITKDINDVYNELGYDNFEEFIEDLRHWCYSSKSKTFNADIDGPTFTAGNTKKEVSDQIKKALKGI